MIKKGIKKVGKLFKEGWHIANTFEDSIKIKGGLKKSNKTEDKVIKKLWG